MYSRSRTIESAKYVQVFDTGDYLGSCFIAYLIEPGTSTEYPPLLCSLEPHLPRVIQLELATCVTLRDHHHSPSSSSSPSSFNTKELNMYIYVVVPTCEQTQCRVVARINCRQMISLLLLFTNIKLNGTFAKRHHQVI